MAVTFKKIDRNRWRKVYPTVRAIPRQSWIPDNDAILETAMISFTNSSEQSYTFTGTYTSAPTVVAIADTEDVNVFISSVTTLTVTVGASAAFTGNVYLQIILLGGC